MKDSFMEGLWTYLCRKRGNFSACFIFNHEVQVLAGLHEEKGLCLGQLVISNSYTWRQGITFELNKCPGIF